MASNGSLPYNQPPGSAPNEMPEAFKTGSVATKPRPLLKQNTALGLTSPETEEDKSLADLRMRFECAVCFEMYSESGPHAPRSLLCGHTFCTGQLLLLYYNYLQGIVRGGN